MNPINNIYMCMNALERNCYEVTLTERLVECVKYAFYDSEQDVFREMLRRETFYDDIFGMDGRQMFCRSVKFWK